MKKYSLLLILSVSAFFCYGQPLHVMTYNVRLNIASDSANSWQYRRDNLASVVLFHQAHILGVQEALHDQMVDLQQRLPQYKSVGGGRDDGKEKGEASAIFYDTVRLQLLQTDMLWLSLTPNVPGSKSWDAAITRMVTWAKFKDRKTKKIFFAFNTHFDHIGQVARKESAKIVLNKAKEIAGNTPLIFTGDFNAKPGDEPIQVITDKSNPLHLTDAKELSQTPHYGPTGTFNAFKNKEINDEPIDYIFLKGKWKVLSHATISQTWQGKFASDHFAVFASLEL